MGVEAILEKVHTLSFFFVESPLTCCISSAPGCLRSSPNSVFPKGLWMQDWTNSVMVDYSVFKVHVERKPPYLLDNVDGMRKVLPNVS